MGKSHWQCQVAVLLFALLTVPTTEHTAVLGGQAAEENAQGSRSPAAAGNTAPLYLLTYDHGGVVLWGSDHFANYLRSAAEWLDRYPSFKIGLDNEAYTYDFLAEHDPKVLDQIRQYLKKYPGRFGIGTCTYGQPLSAFINEESNVRQIEYALESDRLHLGCAPSVYLMSEHAMHSQIPQILTGFGFTGSIMRTHYMMYGYNPTFDAPTGWWIGVDGSRIPTIPTYPGQGAQFGRTTKDNWILTRFPGKECQTPLEDFTREFAHIQPLLASRADDSSLRREELVQMYEGKPGYRWILLEEIASTFPAPTKEFKTAPNDFRVRMPWGYCGNEIWDQSRRAEVAVLTAERLAALNCLLGGDNHESELREAWKNLLVAQHHDIQICGLLKDARTFLTTSLAAADRVTQASLRHLGSQMKGGPVAQVTVFNPLSWRRPEWLEVAISLPRGAAKAVEARHAADVVPSALLSADRYSDGSIREGRLAILADPPPLGLAAYTLAPAQGTGPQSTQDVRVDSAGLRVTTSCWVIEFHRDGGMASLRDARNGQELLQPGKRSGFFAGTIDGRPHESKGAWSLEPARGGGPWVVAREAGLLGSIPYCLEMTFHANNPRIDCRATFHFAGQQIGRVSDNPRDATSAFVHEEKLRWKLFPAVGDSPVGVRDLPFVVAETSDRYVEGNYWTALTGANATVGIFNRGTMGSVREEGGGFSVPLAFAMNYIWGTRMLNGDFAYQFALYPAAGDWGQADLHRRALEYNFPCVGVCHDPGNGPLDADVQLLDVSSPGVVLSALTAKGRHVYARLYEYRGREGECSLEYLKGPAQLTEVDLGGREIKPVSSAITLDPWQFKTIRIDPRDR